MASVSGGGGLSPKDVENYKKDFEKSVDIFKESLDGMSKADGMDKKAAFRKSMEEALGIMDQISPILNKTIQEQKMKLITDYNNYTVNDSADNLQKLQNDISGLKQSLS